jgi:hypothetical protein
VLPHYSLRYEYPNQCARAPVLPGVLLLFAAEMLIHVSATGNLYNELSTKGPRHHRTTHFTCEVIFDHEWRTARAAELTQHLIPRGRR